VPITASTLRLALACGLEPALVATGLAGMEMGLLYVLSDAVCWYWKGASGDSGLGKVSKVASDNSSMVFPAKAAFLLWGCSDIDEIVANRLDKGYYTSIHMFGDMTLTHYVHQGSIVFGSARLDYASSLYPQDG
jgi:hypothetical protein